MSAFPLILQAAQSGSAASSSLAFTNTCFANEVLVVFIAQNSSTLQPTVSDNISGSTGWTFQTTSATYGASSTDSIWVATKTAVGSEKTITAGPGTGGTVEGLAIYDLAGVINSVDAIAGTNTTAQAKTASATISTTTAGDIILSGTGLAASSGTVSAFTGTDVMGNLSTAASRCIGGSYAAYGTTLSSVTFTSNWNTSQYAAELLVAIKPAPIAIMQRGAAEGSSGSASTSNSQYQVVQSAIVIMAFANLSSASSLAVSDTSGSTYALINSGTNSSNLSYAVWIAYDVASAGTGANTMTVTSSSGYLNFSYWQLSGVPFAGAVDGIVEAFQTSATSLSSGSWTTTNANDALLVGSVIANHTATWTAGSGYVNLANESNTNLFSAMEEKLVTSTGSYSGTFSLNSNSNNTVTILLAVSNTEPSLPAVSTQAATSVTNTTATLNGTVTSTGGGTIAAEGFFYSTTTLNPNIGTSGVAVVNATPTGGTGTFSYNITGLSPGTLYYVNAFAVNQNPGSQFGTDANDSYSFTTTGGLHSLSLLGVGS